MNSRNIVNLALVGIVAVLVVLVILEPGRDEPASAPKLTQAAPETVSRIEIRREGQPDIDLSKKDGRWLLQLHNPERTVPASQFRIDNLLRLLTSTSHTHFTPAPDALAKYKLDRPNAVIRLDGIEIAFGDTEPINNRRYVRIGNEIHLITDSYYQHLASAPLEFVDKALLPGNPLIAALTLPGIALVQGADGQWGLTPPNPGISADALNSFVDEWRYAQALEVRPYTGTAKTGEAVLKLKNNGEVRYTIVAKAPNLVLARPDWGVEYQFSEQTAKRLLDPAEHKMTAAPSQP